MKTYLKFKDFEIREPTTLIKKDENYYKYNFDIVKWENDHKNCFSIGFLRFDPKEFAFEFESVGMRWFKYRTEGLEEIILKWTELMEINFKYEEEN